MVEPSPFRSGCKQGLPETNPDNLMCAHFSKDIFVKVEWAKGEKGMFLLCLGKVHTQAVDLCNCQGTLVMWNPHDSGPLNRVNGKAVTNQVCKCDTKFTLHDSGYAQRSEIHNLQISAHAGSKSKSEKWSLSCHQWKVYLQLILILVGV